MEKMNIRTTDNKIPDKEIINEVKKQTIFWSNDRNEHIFFDFKLGNKWISSISIDNELENVIIEIF